MAEPIATVQQGQLKGITDTDLNGDEYFKFLGIPYAKPPVGSLRFKAPQPAEPWSGVRDANKEGNPSISGYEQRKVGSEDCLYLNVFTKEMPKKGIKPKAVMVCIHGGAFTLMDGGEQWHGSQHLLTQDIVLVTMNYRLGLLGFLSSDDLSLDIPGNAGLKDQTFALKWVQENIASFNGDPNNVTIFGISAGGASVHFQILSSLAKGLFHKAIVQSGAALNTWSWGQKNVIQVAEKLGKKVSSDREALHILMEASADEMFEACLQLPDTLLNGNIRRPFGPVVEKPNPTAFLSENPYDLLTSGKFIQVPTIYGICSNEGLSSEFGDLAKDVNPKEVGAFWSLGENREKREQIKALVNEVYFKNGVTTEAKHAIIGDIGFNIGVIESAKLAAKSSSSPVYFYVFDYVNSITKKTATFLDVDISKYEGVTHGADYPFLFRNIMAPGVPDDEGKNAIKMITKIWADFARTSTPHENWLPVTDVNELNYFHITANPTLKQKPFEERVAVWEKVFKDIATFDARIQERTASETKL